ncbi:hypothetical protein BDR26DRAFT_566508 [Obelidium mucronatum]|nr:hypothetical protein BDR26DRAFT_566508 [Obelidium mucronatum]
MASQTLFEVVFASLLHIMQLKDTIGSRKALVAILKTLPILIKTQRRDVFAFLGDTVTKSCLQVISGCLLEEIIALNWRRIIKWQIFHDGYFQEVHNEAISLIGEIYLGLRNANDSTAYQTLLALPGMSSTSLQAFDNQFMTPEKNKKERNVILRHFLKRIKGTSVSEAFKEFDGKAAAKVQLGETLRDEIFWMTTIATMRPILDVLF